METITPDAMIYVERSSGIWFALFSPRLSHLFFTNGSKDISVARIYRLGLFPSGKKTQLQLSYGPLKESAGSRNRAVQRTGWLQVRLDSEAALHPPSQTLISLHPETPPHSPPASGLIHRSHTVVGH